LIAPHFLKSLGYLISIGSVILLGIVSAKSAKEDPFLLACLIGGMLTSIVGMALRWSSYVIEKHRGGTG
jgi:hypothetical protein